MVAEIRVLGELSLVLLGKAEVFGFHLGFDLMHFVLVHDFLADFIEVLPHVFFGDIAENLVRKLFAENSEKSLFGLFKFLFLFLLPLTNCHVLDKNGVMVLDFEFFQCHPIRFEDFTPAAKLYFAHFRIYLPSNQILKIF